MSCCWRESLAHLPRRSEPPIGITTAYGSANAVALTDDITWVPSSKSNCLEGTRRGVHCSRAILLANRPPTAVPLKTPEARI